MTKALAKVHKNVSKKKSSLNSLHEKSRDAKKLRRAGARSEKLDDLKARRLQANEKYTDRVAFFQENFGSTSGTTDGESIHSLIQSYLQRHDQELAELQTQRRPGRPANPQEAVLKRKMDAEEQEYSAGFWVPDLTNDKTVEQLQLWDGRWESLSTMQFVRLRRAGGTTSSSFPPNGQS